MSQHKGLRVLVVDDDPKLQAFLLQGLTESGLLPQAANSAAAAQQLLEQERFDLILLDVMMPGSDGRDVLKKLRSDGDDTPVIMVTARDTTEERVEGLKLGADDYVVKPFAFAELLARMDAVKWQMLEEWSRTKRAPQHAAWLHARELDKALT